jgi:hypothetical protein
MGLLEILDHRLSGAAQDEPLTPGPGLSGSSARTRNDVLVATSRSGTCGGGLRILSGPGRPKRRSHVSVRKKTISSAVTNLRARYTCAFDAEIRMEWNSLN